MKELVLVRHGESDAEVRGLTGGWTDSELTELGWRQGMATGEKLKRMLQGRDVKVYGSDLVRAAETAKIIGRLLGSRPILREELRELNNGDAAGLTKEAARKIELPVTQPTEDWRPYPRAESWRMMTDRMFQAMGNVAREVEDAAVVVTHGSAAMAAVGWWLGIERAWERKIAFEFDLASISVLGVNRWGERTVRRLNDMSHLEQLRGERDRPGRNAREVSRKVLAEGKFLNLQVIRWIGKDGQKRQWEVAERIGGKNAVMLIAWLKPSQRLVLVRQYRPPALGSVIEFPAGIMNAGETPEQTAVRELHEETGYRGTVLDVTPPALNTPGLSDDAAYMVLLEVDETWGENLNAVARPEDGEEIEVVLVERGRMGDFVRSELSLGVQFDGKVIAYVAGMTG